LQAKNCGNFDALAPVVMAALRDQTAQTGSNHFFRFVVGFAVAAQGGRLGARI
jgi:hypothetical protein